MVICSEIPYARREGAAVCFFSGAHTYSTVPIDDECPRHAGLGVRAGATGPHRRPPRGARGSARAFCRVGSEYRHGAPTSGARNPRCETAVPPNGAAGGGERRGVVVARRLVLLLCCTHVARLWKCHVRRRSVGNVAARLLFLPRPCRDLRARYAYNVKERGEATTEAGR